MLLRASVVSTEAPSTKAGLREAGRDFSGKIIEVPLKMAFRDQ
jgi:hypothetical protein